MAVGSRRSGPTRHPHERGALSERLQSTKMRAPDFLLWAASVAKKPFGRSRPPMRQSMLARCCEPKGLEKLVKKKYSVYYYFFPYGVEGFKRRKSKLYKPLTSNGIFGPIGTDRQFNPTGLHLGRVRRLKNLADEKKSPDGCSAGAGERAFQTFDPPSRFGNSAGMQREAKGHFAGPGATLAVLPGPPPSP
jgi:hypothetical protein